MKRRDFLKAGLIIGSTSLLPSFAFGDSALPKRVKWHQINLCQFDSFQRNIPLIKVSDINVTMHSYDDVDIDKSKLFMKEAGGTDYIYYQINCGKHYGLITVPSNMPLDRNGIDLRHYINSPKRRPICGIYNYAFIYRENYNSPSSLPKNVFDKLDCEFWYDNKRNGELIEGEKYYRTEESAMIDLIRVKESLGI